MEDNNDQSVADDLDDEQPSEPVSRLIQRQSQPAGLIDVRYAQRKYARTSGWVAQRFPMLKSIIARYGGTEAAAATDQPLVMGQSLKESAGGFADLNRDPSPVRVPLDTAARSNATATASPILRSPADIVSRSPRVSQAHPSADSSSPPVKLRVSRRHAQLAPKPEAAATPVPRPIHDSPTEETPSGNGDTTHAEPAAKTQQFSDGAATVEALSTSNTEPPPALILAKSAEGHADREVSFDSQDAVSAAGEQSEASSGDMNFIQRSAISQGVSRKEPGGSVTPQTAVSLIMRKSARSEEPRANFAAPAAAPFAEPAAPEVTERQAPLPVVLPLVEQSKLARKPQGDNADPPLQSQVLPVSKDDPGHPVAAEIRSNPSHSLPGIIWRKAASDSPQVAARTNPQPAGDTFIARQPDNGNSTAASAKSAPEITKQAPQGGDSKVQQITDEVIRALSRRLEVERERRGIEK